MSAQSSSEVRLPPNFDPRISAHRAQLEKYIADKAGPDWRISHLDPERGVAVLAKSSNFMSVTDSSTERKLVGLEEGTKESDGDRVAASLAEKYPGFYMTSFEPYLLRAELSRLDQPTQRARLAVSTALSVKPWKVGIAKRPDGGFTLALPDSYMPSRHYEKLDEAAKEVIGDIGWYVNVNTNALTAEIIPSDPPTFPGTIRFPMNKKSTSFDFTVSFGVKLPEPGQDRLEPLNVDLTDAMLQLGGLAGSGKSVTLNALITSALSNGFELAIADTADKAVDFEWCKDFVRPLGWGCDGLPGTVGMLGNLYDEGKERAALIRKYGVKKLAELPPEEFARNRPILIVVDEVTGLFSKDVVPKSLPKDHPMRMDAEEQNIAVDMIKSYINKIAAEQRFVGARLALSTQVASRDTGIDTKLRTNLHHKAQPLSSLLPVPVSEKFPNGWATIGELEVGDRVIAPDGSLPEVSNLTPIRRGEVYRMTFDDGQTSDSDAGHQWVVLAHYSRSAQGTGRIAKKGERPLLKVVTTEEIAQEVKLRTASDKPANNYAIPLTAAVNFPEADLPLDPYILGAWLGDGVTGSGEIASSRARSCTDEQGVADQEHMIGHLREFRPRPKPSSPASVISTTGLKARLRVAGVLTDKHIPAIYLRSSISQRLALLQGLMDTGGWASSDRGYCAYATTSEKLRDGVVELIRSLGIKATIGESESSCTSTDEHEDNASACTDSTAYRIQFRTTVPVFRLPRKLRNLPDSDVPGSSLAHFITSIEKVGVDEVRCIEVDHPDHLYLTDGFITTHNCLQGTNPTEANKRLIFPNADIVPDVPTNVAEDAEASRGVGLAQLEGAAPAVYKSFYADTDELYDYLVSLGVPRHSGQSPSSDVIDRYLPRLDGGDSEPAPSQSVKNRKAMEAQAMIDPETGERMTPFEYANLQRSRSVRKSQADAMSGEG